MGERLPAERWPTRRSEAVEGEFIRLQAPRYLLVARLLKCVELLSDDALRELVWRAEGLSGLGVVRLREGHVRERRDPLAHWSGHERESGPDASE